MSLRAFYDEDVPAGALDGETVAVIGYGIQGRAQALTLRDAGVAVVVGNRDDDYRRQAAADGFEVVDVGEAVDRGSIVLLLVPDEVQPAIYRQQVAAHLAAGDALVFAHGFAVRYGLIAPPADVDLLLLAPRLPGTYLRRRYLEGWGVPAFVAVERDASGAAWRRLLGLAGALGITRCAALEGDFALETELDHFSEHVTLPLIFRALELAFDVLTAAGYPPEAALMELHGSGELGQVLAAAAEEGLYGMIASHASPACQVGMAHHWDDAAGDAEEARRRMARALAAIRDGRFARHLLAEQEAGYPELRRWREGRPQTLAEAEKRLRRLLRPPASAGGSRSAPRQPPRPAT
ncbi:MAG: ketol-acid reductoisomerase [Acidobacteria bacterium]|nr:MAG: ketol-acid reductoisomerase [Acidobacteriota bacterium]